MTNHEVENEKSLDDLVLEATDYIDLHLTLIQDDTIAPYSLTTWGKERGNGVVPTLGIVVDILTHSQNLPIEESYDLLVQIHRKLEALFGKGVNILPDGTLIEGVYTRTEGWIYGVVASLAQKANHKEAVIIEN